MKTSLVQLGVWVVGVSLAACGNAPALDSTANGAATSLASDSDGKDDSSIPAVEFDGTGPMPTLTIGKIPITQYQTSDALNAIIQRMSEIGKDSNTFAAASYILDPNDLDFVGGFEVALTDHAAKADLTQAKIVYTLMDQADGSSGGVEFDPQYNRYRCDPIAVSKASATFRSFHGFQVLYTDTQQVSAADRAELLRDARIVTKALRANMTNLAALSCHWDNADDTNRDAILLIDRDSGEVRVFTVLEV